MAAVRAGEDAAFEELYRRYNARILAFVHRFVRDRGRAEDVTQEAFLSALRRLRETDTHIAFKPWIYEIARNAAIDLHRRNSRAEEVSINDDEPLHPADRGRLVGSDAPERALVDKQRIEHLRGAFDELSDTHHRILVLRELEGRSYREIADRMELTAPAVESTLFRARRRLEREYSDLDTGRRCASIRVVIARLSEGIELPRERRRLERHAIRCSGCRRQARELGIDPVPTGGLAKRAAALVPLPALLRRRRGSRLTGDGGAAGGGSLAQVAGPGMESAGMLAGKAGAFLAAVVLVGGGGATLGGVGPLSPFADGRDQIKPLSAPSGAGGAGGAQDAAPGRLSGGGQAAPGTAERGNGTHRGLPGTPGPRALGEEGAGPGAGLPGAPALPELGEDVPGLPPVESAPPKLDVPPPSVPDGGGLPDLPRIPDLPDLPGALSAPEPPAAPEAPAPEAPSTPDLGGLIGGEGVGGEALSGLG